MKTRGDRESRFLLPALILSRAFFLSRLSLPTMHQKVMKAVFFEYNTKKNY